jgi:hypothetical protein
MVARVQRPDDICAIEQCEMKLKLFAVSIIPYIRLNLQFE